MSFSWFLYPCPPLVIWAFLKHLFQRFCLVSLTCGRDGFVSNFFVPRMGHYSLFCCKPCNFFVVVENWVLKSDHMVILEIILSFTQSLLIFQFLNAIVVYLSSDSKLFPQILHSCHVQLPILLPRLCSARDWQRYCWKLEVIKKELVLAYWFCARAFIPHLPRLTQVYG